MIRDSGMVAVLGDMKSQRIKTAKQDLKAITQEHIKTASQQHIKKATQQYIKTEKQLLRNENRIFGGRARGSKTVKQEHSNTSRLQNSNTAISKKTTDQYNNTATHPRQQQSNIFKQEQIKRVHLRTVNTLRQ